MLFMLRVHLSERANTSNKEFYSVWRQEAEAAVAALKAGAIKGLWKAAGEPEVIAIMDLPNADDLDHALHQCRSGSSATHIS
jgi:muconolactone delta-isomerase